MRRLVAGGALGVLASLASAGLLLVSGWLVSRAAEQPPVLYLLVAVVAVRALGVARAVLRYVERLLTHDAALRRLGALRAGAWEGVRRHPADLPGGDLVRRVTADVDAVQDRVLRVWVPALVTAVTAVAVTGLVWRLLPAAGLVLGCGLAVAAVAVPLLVGWAVRRTEAEVAPLGGVLATQAADAARTAPELAAAGATRLALDPLRATSSRLREVSRRATWTEGLGNAVGRLVLGAVTCASAWLAADAVASGTLAPVLAAVVVLAPLALAEAVEELPGLVRTEVRTRAARDRVHALASSASRTPCRHGVHTPDTVLDPCEATKHHVYMVFGGPPPVRVRGLRAGWPGGPDVLSGLDLDVGPGEVVVVSGPSGSGKSTLAHVLLGLLPARAGTVEVGGDGLDVRGDDVRSVLGLLAQDEHVLDTTVEENLRVADPGADAAALWDALDAARLGDLVRGLPDGLATPVGEHGGRLSGGERQRLGLARQLLADRPVLVLDEPTEHLDEAAAEALVADLCALAPARSLLVLSHQPVWHDHADRVVHLPASPSGADLQSSERDDDESAPLGGRSAPLGERVQDTESGRRAAGPVPVRADASRGSRPGGGLHLGWRPWTP